MNVISFEKERRERQTQYTRHSRKFPNVKEGEGHSVRNNVDGFEPLAVTVQRIMNGLTR